MNRKLKIRPKNSIVGVWDMQYAIISTCSQVSDFAGNSRAQKINKVHTEGWNITALVLLTRTSTVVVPT